MKYLFVNSATANLVVAVIIDGKITYLFDEECQSFTSSKIMPVIDEAFRMSNIEPSMIDKIFVVNGPGSFTGIRIGLSFCKVMAYCLNIPIVTISSLEVMASGFNNDVTSVVDARRGYVYAGSYDKDLNILHEDEYVLYDNLQTCATLVSYDDLSTVKPKLDLIKVINKHKDDEGTVVHNVNPNYLKLTEAEEKRLNDKEDK